MKQLIVSLLVIVLLLPSLVSAADYYIDYESGSDSNDGISTLTPWQHCPGDDNAVGNAGSTSLQPADVVYFKGGVEYSGEIDTEWSGSAGNYIVYDGNSDGSWGSGQALWNGYESLYHAFHNSNSDYITIQNFDFKRCANARTVSNEHLGVIDVDDGNNWLIKNCIFHHAEDWNVLAEPGVPEAEAYVRAQNDAIRIESGGSDIEIDNCEFYAWGRTLIAIIGADDVTIHDCDFGGRNRDSSETGWFSVALRPTNGAKNLHVYDCVFHDGWQYEGDEPERRSHAGDWIHVYADTETVTGVIERCLFYNDKQFEQSHGSAISFLDHTEDFTWRNNIFINPHAINGCIGLRNLDSIRIYNNIFVIYQNGEDTSKAIIIQENAEDVIISNNIFMQLSSYSFSPVNRIYSGWGGTMSNNLYYHVNGPSQAFIRYGGTTYTFDEWVAQGIESDSSFGDPELAYLPATGATSSDGNYHLTEDSVNAIDRALSLISTGFSDDYEGNSRPQGSGWDIGAYEFQNSPPNRHYIRSGAASGGDGSDWASAWQQLPLTLERGHTYYIADGTYPGYTFDDAENGQYITIRKAINSTLCNQLGKTAQDCRGTNKGWQDDYGDDQAIFQNSGTVIMIGADDIEIDGQVGSRKSGYGIKFHTNIAASNTNNVYFLTPADNIIFRYVEMEQTPGGTDILNHNIYSNTGGGSNINISHCYLHDANWKASILVRSWSSYTIEYSYISDINNKEGISDYYGTNVVIRYNIWENVAGTSVLAIRDGNGWEIYGNVFFVSDPSYTLTDGVITNWVGHGYTASNMYIYNNVFVDLTGRTGIGFDNGNNLQIRNNIFYNNENFGLNGITHDYNAFSGTSAYSEANAQIGLASSIFVDYAGDDFHLDSATNPGDNALGSPYNIDMDGNIRGSDGVWDRGAYEYGGGPCISDCAGKDCGNNGCGGSCGTCGFDETCTLGQCITDPCWNKNSCDDYSNQADCNNNVCSVPASCTWDGTCNAAVAPGDMVLWLPFEGNMQDNSDNNYPTYLPTGGHDGNGAYQFNNDIIQIPWNPSPIQDQSFTVSAWVQTSDTLGNHWVIGDDTGYSHFMFGIIDGDLALYWRYQPDYEGRFYWNTGQALPSGYHHIAATYNAVTDDVYVYLDGEEAAIDTTTNPEGITDISALQVGNGFSGLDTNPQYFNGLIDDVRIYNTALTWTIAAI